MSPDMITEDRYSGLFAKQAGSPTLRAIYRAAYGSDYPEELDPFGFVTRADLDRVGELLALPEGATMADIGCGRGGPGLFVARASGARLTGVDVVPGAVVDAALRSRGLGVPDARFTVGSFTATGLPAASCDGVMSVDTLWMVVDKEAAVAEIARVLRPGGRFVLTTWEPTHADHAELLRAAGFEVLVREETPRWLERQQAVYSGVLAARAVLEAELGVDGAAVLIREAEETPDVLADTPRLLLAAHHP
ncbi:class I SAM-dependent methyltransferase [Pseudonocardia sp. TRM90224]|uniref:class I SAM-dependent methyltransferase n=1 Tax=Pseudonocardia sp. TRM90224 TaxID=2812678 RepID=UPI001E526C2E|nr:class I SAM-dependent methyltransferase [Pseudonocardia sp. TRM90224]